MSQAEYEAWLAQAVEDYAASKVASGQWAAADAVALSVKEHAQLLPEGLATPDHHHFILVDDSESRVGVLWFSVTTRFNAPAAYLYNIEVDPEHRRKGHARSALLALEQEARHLGLAGVALHVFGHNTQAQALYAQLGYEPTNINLFKRLPPSEA